MDNRWNVGQLLFGIQITFAGIVLALIGLGPLALIAAVTGFIVALSGLVARPRTGP